MGYADQRVNAGCSRQVYRTAKRCSSRQNPGAGLHYTFHPETAQGHVSSKRQSGRPVIGKILSNDRYGRAFLLLLTIVTLYVAFANLLIPQGHWMHISTFT